MQVILCHTHCPEQTQSGSKMCTLPRATGSEWQSLALHPHLLTPSLTPISVPHGWRGRTSNTGGNKERRPYAGVPRRGKGLTAPWLGSRGPRVPALLPLGRTQHSSKVLPKPSTPPEYSSSLLQVAESSEGQTPRSVQRVTVRYRGCGGHTHGSGKVLDERASVGACVCVWGVSPWSKYPTRRPPFFEYLHHLSCGVRVWGRG